MGAGNGWLWAKSGECEASWVFSVKEPGAGTDTAEKRAPFATGPVSSKGGSGYRGRSGGA